MFPKLIRVPFAGLSETLSRATSFSVSCCGLAAVTALAFAVRLVDARVSEEALVPAGARALVGPIRCVEEPGSKGLPVAVLFPPLPLRLLLLLLLVMWMLPLLLLLLPLPCSPSTGRLLCVVRFICRSVALESSPWVSSLQGRFARRTLYCNPSLAAGHVVTVYIQMLKRLVCRIVLGAAV